MKSWRRSRPFWGGLFIVAAGVELLSISLAINILPVAVLFGTVGAGYLIALVLTLAGVLVWLQPGQRIFLGLVAVVLSMASFVYSNLGGFLIGMISGLLGGVLAMAWTPDSRPAGRVDALTLTGAIRWKRAPSWSRNQPAEALSSRGGRSGRDDGEIRCGLLQHGEQPPQDVEVAVVIDAVDAAAGEQAEQALFRQP